ncbi:MAG TPA: universal stress protein, partial [Burkholderiaceae bacterium]|nr:universal stress protein [Burkholderiaceae bacterium]
LRILHLVDDLLYATGFETYAAYVNDVIPLMREVGERILQDGRLRAEKAGVPVETQLVEGFATRLADVVADQADAWHADLIVIGTHGRRGVSRLVLGSDAEHVMRTAPVPVLLVRSKGSIAA